MTSEDKREVALSLAIQYLDGSEGIHPDLVLETADIFYEWIEKGSR